MSVRMSGGGAGVSPSSNLEVNSLGVGIAPDGTTGDALVAGGLATGGNAAPATAGDVYVGRASGSDVAEITLGRSVAAARATITAGIPDSAGNPIFRVDIEGTEALIVGNVYNQLRPALPFAALPAASAALEGALASVSDSTTAVWGATITGSGANHVLAYCDGTNWTVAAI